MSRPAGGAGEVLFEPELVFEALHDRLDPLADGSDRRARPFVLRSAGAQEGGAERGYGLLELGAGEALVGDHELAFDRLALEQAEHRLP
ncbi:MAG: hypothetical protein ABR583_10060, partial [Gaiellaceae bacterium]